jgi:ABC-2 type transport system permease protein
MKKYWLLIKNTWDERVMYRLSFFLWRMRMVIRLLITFFLWSAIFSHVSSGEQLFGYTQAQMLTYVLAGYLINNFVFATRTLEIGADINEGRLTTILIRPLNYFSYLISRDIGDKLLNVSFTLFEVVAFILIIKPPVLLGGSPLLLLLTLVAFIGSILLYFYFSCLLGLIGFWTTEVWALRFVFFILVDFLAGNFMPIDVFPALIARVLLLTPFPYMVYFPVKIYLGQLQFGQIAQGLAVMSLWLLVFRVGVSWVWKKGLRIYSAEGR